MADQKTLDNPQPFDHLPTAIEILNLPNAGMYHTKSELWNVYFDKDLKKKSDKFLSEFTDYITRGSFEQNWFKELYNNIILDTFPCLNMCKIGTIAYITLYTNDVKFKSNAQNILKKWRYNPYTAIKISKRTLVIPQPFGEYPEYKDIIALPNMGCYYSMEVLNEMSHYSGIKSISTKYLANYVNYIGIGSLEQQWFIDNLIFDYVYIKKEGINTKNTITFIGNIAYVYLHHTNPHCRKIANDILNIWRDG